jgi:hypothetical protein
MAQNEAALAEIVPPPRTIHPVRRLNGTIRRIDPARRRAHIRMRLPNEYLGFYTMTHDTEADLTEVRVTDGVTGDSWECSPTDQLAGGGQAVRLTLSQPLYLPAPGEPLVLPETLLATEVTAPDGRPILVVAKGRLSSWTPWQPALRKGGTGYITTLSSRNGGKVRVFVRYDNLGPNDLPYKRDVRPQIDQPVRYTARPNVRGRNPDAEAVHNIDGGPVVLEDRVELDEEVEMEP